MVVAIDEETYRRPPFKDVQFQGAPDWFELAAHAHPVEANDPVAFGATAAFDANDSTGPPDDGVNHGACEIAHARQYGAPRSAHRFLLFSPW